MKSNNYYKSYNVSSILYSNTYNKLNNYHNSSNIVPNKNYSKKFLILILIIMIKKGILIKNNIQIIIAHQKKI